ncbi:MAG TPA: UDP-N-acetylmuramoyl-L-alanyl-D-glutamate--2,6-diaminopimelate ligase [Caldithrix abyssi]|uniref:UDP-N-acetylmuramoyl-L-alanyl-D-glutamate--2,6-diaminopimelate ligase n=1 Tax=Caldithrix abyssi TaxID=187145 RepID=A0A7V4U413_CALAY|nr:UDP-N-acetylmuramoyl-L-alanyl-D-glutamate--2,6-diaminopimelate ligase [Caldithrix abyssi]
MKPKTIEQLLQGITQNIPESLRGQIINALEYDSRKITKGGLFVAVPGFSVDGHSFLTQVQKQGAAAAVVERKSPGLALPQIIVENSRLALARLAANLYRESIAALKLVGITGTNGKTTTSFLVRSILGAAGTESGLIGTIAYYYADKTVNAWNTTPESLDICRILDTLVQHGQKACVLEVSSHALELHRVDGLRFDAAVFTNLSRDHLDFHKSEEAYFRAKARLFSLLSDNGRAVINADDPYGRRLLDEYSSAALSFGFTEQADVRALDWTMDANGMRIRLQTPSGQIDLHSRLISEFNVKNIMAAVATALALGVDREAIRKGVENLSYVPGRLESFTVKKGVKAVVDYAHTPDALQKALQAVRRITERKLIVVFGAGGDRDRGKRPQMAEAAQKEADWVIVTSDNPRSEDPRAIIEDILKGMKNGSGYDVIVDRREAIRQAVAMARPGDLILIAGKGHEKYQDINGVKHPFDDVTVAKEAEENV